jgi:hypothetical protein
MSLVILGDNGKIFLKFSPYAYSPNTAKYFPHILHWRLNSFQVFSEYAERKFYLQQCLSKLKGQYYEKISMGDHKLAYDEQITIFIFWLSLT